MSDIVERLRGAGLVSMVEAAAHIEAQAAEIARLRAALEHIKTLAADHVSRGAIWAVADIALSRQAQETQG